MSNPYASDATATTGIRKPGRWDILLLLGVLSVIAVLFLPAVNSGHRCSPRTMCKNNLKQLGIALHNYHDEYGSFPPAFTLDEQGRRLHSWRALLLPFAEQAPLYRKLDLSKSWNHPVNAEVRDSCPAVFRCPAADLPDGYTTYKAAIGLGAAFDLSGGVIGIDDMLDGTSQTILVVEGSPLQASHWMDPYDDDGLAVLIGLTSKPETPHRSTINALFADGSCHCISVNTKPDVLQSLTTIAGGETVDIDEW